jgi:putative ABC transport system permease protein
MKRWLERLWRGRRLDQDVREEIESHLEMRAEMNRGAGLSTDDAGDLARRQFGNSGQVHEDVRRIHLGEWLEGLQQDLRYAWRSLLRAPAFTVTAILAAALGIGATTAVFSAVDRILFRSLPYPAEDRLVSFGFAAPIEPQEFMLGTDYVEWRERQTPFAEMATWASVSDCDLTDRNPARLSCAEVESTFLQTLGVRPLLGRDFTPEDDRPNSSPAALISYGLWQSRFAADPGIAGKTLSLDGKTATIAGVLPASFELPTLARADVLVPLRLDPATQRRPQTGRLLWAIARLKPGVPPDQANQQLAPLFAESLKWVPPNFRKEVKLRVRSLRDRQVQDARLASWVLLGAVLAVLLIACANVANLMLVRATARQRELAVRQALGAGKARLVRQTLTESVLLGLLGGAAGCVLARLLLRLFVAIAPESIPRLAQAALDGRVLAVAIALAVLSGVLFGLPPAFQIPHAEWPTGSRVSGSPRLRFRESLVAAQIAVSLILLTGAALLLRSLWKLESVPLGMRTAAVLTARISLARDAQPERQLAFFEELESRLARLPGVSSLAVTDSVPPVGPARSMIFSAIEIEGRPRFGQGTGGMVTWRTVTPGYFGVLDIPIRRGRSFQDGDRAPDEHAVILNEALAARLYPREDALGKRIRPGLSGPWLTIIGVSANVRNNGLSGQDGPEYYVVRRHSVESAFRESSVLIRTQFTPKAMSDWVRREVATLDPTLPVALETMDQRVAKLAERPRFNATLLGLFAAIGALLAAVGLYGVISFLVAQRTQEIGIRMALGATRAEIARLVLHHAAPWTLVGVLAGIVGSLFATRVLRTLLFGVPEKDPITLVTVSGILLGVAGLASWLPSRRAAQVDPMVALRQD